MNKILQNLCNTTRQVQKLLSDVMLTPNLLALFQVIDKTTRDESQSGCTCRACMLVCSVRLYHKLLFTPNLHTA